MRRTLALTMRALGRRGLAAMLPDLPGQNDSLTPTSAATLALWRGALASVASAVTGPLLIASWRGGTLIDDAAQNAIGWWRMAPVSGGSILKTLLRARIAGEREAGRSVTAEGLLATATSDATLELAGHQLSRAMIDALTAATPATVTRLRQRDLGSGAEQLPGSALWLRAEPGEDAAMAEAMAADIHDWAAQCVAG